MSGIPEIGKNQRIVSVGIADLGIASIVFIYGSIFSLLLAFKVHVHNPFLFKPIPVIGLFISLGWIFVAWKLIKSGDKEKDIRQRRRYVLYWTCYSVIIAILNVGVIIWFITIIAVKDYHGKSYIVAIIISVVILCMRGFIFVAVLYYSKELLDEYESSRRYNSFSSKVDTNNDGTDKNGVNKKISESEDERIVIVTPV